MAYNVKFLKGLSSAYTALTSKDANTFYYTTDDSQLYLGSIRLSNGSEIAAAITRIAKNETDIATIQTQIATITGTGAGSIKKAVADAKAELEGIIGALDDLSTTAKGDLVSAINEVKGLVAAGGEAGTITIDTTSTTAGALKSYTIKQGGVSVGVIDIPKDMVVESGEVVKNPEGQVAGTYIKLTLANVAEPLYINVGSLVDIYTAQGSATEVQLAINSTTREISATIVNGSVTSDKLANNAVITTKIADNNVTKAKLATDVQTSLGKADSAVQSVVESTINGNISVDGTDVPVHGLGTAAFLDEDNITSAASDVQANLDAYKSSNDTKVNKNTSDIAAINNATTGILAQAKTDATTKADAALQDAKDYADGLAGNYATAEQGAKADTALQKADITTGTANGTIAVKGSNVAVKGLGSAAYVATSAFDPAGSASTAETNAKSYVDTALTWGTIA